MDSSMVLGGAKLPGLINWRGEEDGGMRTTVDDNPPKADNPSTLPYFPLFSLPQASLLQMTNSGP